MSHVQRTPANPPRIVVIGGGFAGLRVAKGLSGRGAAIILVDRRNYHVFQPLLYQVATAVLSPAPTPRSPGSPTASSRPAANGFEPAPSSERRACRPRRSRRRF